MAESDSSERRRRGLLEDGQAFAFVLALRSARSFLSSLPAVPSDPRSVRRGFGEIA